MSISYRTRQALRRSGSLAAVILGVGILVLGCVFLWLRRYVVYTDEGVELRFDRNTTVSQPSREELSLPSVTVRYDDTPFQEGLEQLSGYYIPESDLKNPQAVQAKLEQLPAGTAVMLDIKGYRGYFFYSTAVGDHTTGLYDTEEVDALIQWLAQSDLYVIARMPALHDYVTVADNNSCGLKTTDGQLYSDRGDYGLGYWLDPTSPTVENYLIDILGELKRKGFDEVILSDFSFPDTENLAFSGDREQALSQLAKKLSTACAGADFVVSFASDDPSYSLPVEGGRLYLQNISAENAQGAWDTAAVEEKRQNLVFIALNSDSRYDIENGILRPLT